MNGQVSLFDNAVVFTTNSADQRTYAKKVKIELYNDHFENAKHLAMEDGCFYVTKEFFDYLQTVLWLGYVETKLGVDE